MYRGCITGKTRPVGEVGEKSLTSPSWAHPLVLNFWSLPSLNLFLHLSSTPMPRR